MDKIILDKIEEMLGKQGETAFDDIWVAVVEELTDLELTMRDKAEVFTNMNLNKKFVVLEDNYWDLRSHHPYEKVHIQLKDIYEGNKVKETEKTKNFDSDIATFVKKTKS